MSQKKPAVNNRKNSWGESNGEFAQVTLTNADKAKFDAWLKSDAPDELEAWKWLMDDSYRVSGKFDYNSNCYMVTLTQQDNKHRNFGVVVTSRSTDPAEAILLSLFKVEVMFAGERLPTETKNSQWG